ncbi:hypothetical protein EJB05_53002 [Eragrostis curvula]|uniref:RING-type E3 ubiquitin transferase n=1 Tax=Eragrostis curvula TaxID=38414 RepID=A0A5J9SRC5_9POAL|nr:hypothetical protein EJB05_53002 [Eragrostis curvula]
MSQGRSTPGGGGGGEGSQRAESPVILADGNGESSANATMEEMLRVLQRQINEETALSTSSAPSSPSRFCPSSPSSLARGVARRFLGKARSSSADSSPTRRSPETSSRGEQASSGLAGTSGSALEAPARTGSVQESSPEQHVAAPTRSDFVAMMRSAVVKIQDDGREVQPVFNEMQQAMTGLMELTYGEAPNPPELPQEFATKWPHDDADPLGSVLMDDPVILASGYSVDQSFHQWDCSLTNTCPVTNKTLSHSFTSPNHLLRDMIAAWRLDHSLCSSSSGVETVSIPMAPSTEQIENILHKFSGHSALQEQALHEIQLLTKITKGEQPCLQKWPGLIQVLIDLQKNWKSTWTQNLEEWRLTTIVNLSVHRPNKEILAGAPQLPDALKKVAAKLHRLGCSASPFAKLASIVASLSEFEMFRRRILDIGGMEMLRDLLKIEDVVVRKEAVTAICGLCTDQEGEAQAQYCYVTDLLVQCLRISDDVLILLDRLPKDPYGVDKLSDKAVELVNIIMADQEAEPVTPVATYSAISLVHTIVQQDASKMEAVKNLEDFMKRLQELSSGSLPMQTMLQLDKIVNILLETFPALASQVQS